MTAYGECAKCGGHTGVDIYDGRPSPVTGLHIKPGAFGTLIRLTHRQTELRSILSRKVRDLARAKDLDA